MHAMPWKIAAHVTIETANAKVGPPERPEEPPAGDYVMIAVTDTGSGMTKEVLAKAFEPFFTTKEIGKGSGLGLSQVLGFAKQSGGGMRIETRVGEGTSVKVYLPRAAENSNSEVAVVTVGGAQSKRKGAIILIVDDDSAVREVTASILEDLGYVVLKVGQWRRCARSPRPAIKRRSGVARFRNAGHEWRGGRAPSPIEISGNPHFVCNGIR